MNKKLEEAVEIVKNIPHKHKDILMSEDLAIARVVKALENSIPKEVIKKKIQELDEEITKVEQMNESATKYDIIQKLDNQSNILQDILEVE